MEESDQVLLCDLLEDKECHSGVMARSTLVDT